MPLYEVTVSRTRRVDEVMDMNVEAEDEAAAEEYAQQCIEAHLSKETPSQGASEILKATWSDLHTEVSYEWPTAQEV